MAGREYLVCLTEGVSYDVFVNLELFGENIDITSPDRYDKRVESGQGRYKGVTCHIMCMKNVGFNLLQYFFKVLDSLKMSLQSTFNATLIPFVTEKIKEIAFDIA
jgi:hypothetical protein